MCLTSFPKDYLQHNVRKDATFIHDLEFDGRLVNEAKSREYRSYSFIRNYLLRFLNCVKIQDGE